MKETTLQGRKNVYLCPDCGVGFCTQDAEDGVTPFLTPCMSPTCGGMARSFFYKVPQEILANVRPAAVWRKPRADERLSPSMARHVEEGGLLRSDILGQPIQQRRPGRVFSKRARP